jgi:hypothetical protein
MGCVEIRARLGHHHGRASNGSGTAWWWATWQRRNVCNVCNVCRAEAFASRIVWLAHQVIAANASALWHCPATMPVSRHPVAHPTASPGHDGRIAPRRRPSDGIARPRCPYHGTPSPIRRHCPATTVGGGRTAVERRTGRNVGRAEASPSTILVSHHISGWRCFGPTALPGHDGRIAPRRRLSDGIARPRWQCTVLLHDFDDFGDHAGPFRAGGGDRLLAAEHHNQALLAHQVEHIGEAVEVG